MSIDSKTKSEETPTVPANNKPAHRRAKSIAEQIAENWRALPKGEQQRWTATTKAIEDDSDFEPLHLHLEPRPLPLPASHEHEPELELEQYPGESRYPTYDTIENTTAWFVDDLLFAPVALPVAGPIMLPPWRRPGAFSGALDHVSFGTIIPLPRDDEGDEDEEKDEKDEEKDEDEKEAAKARCSTPEAEAHFEELKALIVAHKKAEAAQAQAEAQAEAQAQGAGRNEVQRPEALASVVDAEARWPVNRYGPLEA